MNKRFRILLVEDDDVCVMNLKRAFSKMGLRHQLVHAKNGVEALDYLNNPQEGRPTFALLDMHMPKMDGLEFLRNLRSGLHASLPVFMLTTTPDEEARRTAFRYNVAGYVLKPLHFEQYIEAVSTLNSFWELTEWETVA